MSLVSVPSAPHAPSRTPLLHSRLRFNGPRNHSNSHALIRDVYPARTHAEPRVQSQQTTPNHAHNQPAAQAAQQRIAAQATRRASPGLEPRFQAVNGGVKILLLLAAILLATFTSRLARADNPSVIRVGYPGVGVGNRPASFGNAAATMHLRGLLEEEFRKDGIKIQWSFLRGAGPAVNELFANGLLDFSHLGDLPSVVGRSSGLPYRVLASSGVRGNIYVAVPADSPVQSIKDLRGKRVAVNKGTATHLAGLKILEVFGLQDKDVRLLSMDTNTAKAALVTKDIDAVFGGTDLLGLRDQGAVRIVFTTKGGDAKLTSNGLFLGSQKFIDKYPDLTKRVLKSFVLAAKWLADNEAEPTPIYQAWTKSGSTFASFKEDWKNENVRYRTSPLLDVYVAARYKLQIGEAKRLGLIRKEFVYEEWLEPRFLNQVLKELNLETFWRPRGLDGNPSSS